MRETEYAEALLLTHWGVRGTLTRLQGEADLSFRVESAEGPPLVLKISPPGADDSSVAIEEALLAAVDRYRSNGSAEAHIPLPRRVPASNGAESLEVEWTDGSRRTARVLTWLDGRLLAESRPAPPGALRELGAVLGALSDALDGFRHEAAARRHLWDPMRSHAVIRERLGLIEDDRVAALVRTVLDRCEPIVERLEPRLPRGVIHGDANDWNVLLAEGDVPAGGRRVSGLIDLGDATETALVGELAIACAYAMLDEPDPLSCAIEVVVGYDGQRELADAEIEAIWPLALLRLAASLAISAERASASGSNPYLAISRGPAIEALERVAGIPLALVHTAIRGASGRPASPAGARVAEWLEAHRASLVPVLGAAEVIPVEDGVHADLSWADPALAWAERVEDLGTWLDLSGGSALLLRPGTPVALRPSEGSGGVRIGAELLVRPGTAVRCPVEGRLVGLEASGITLEHRPVDGPAFQTAIEGLVPDAALMAGSGVAAGAMVGVVGGDGTRTGLLRVVVVADPGDAEGPVGLDPPRFAIPPLARTWQALTPDPWPLLGLDGPSAAEPPETVEALMERRRTRVPTMLSLSYRRPLHIVRGAGAHLFSADGSSWLDCVNNVAHVGHEHPAVVEAGSRQMRLLNTNTRYLHPLILDYIEALTATLPPELDTVFLVCSGSEANELALRLACTATGREGVVVLDGAYHGNTGALVGISPYKFDGPGGSGCPTHVRVAPMPDDYRGQFRRDDPERGRRYGDQVGAAADRLAAAGIPPAAFIYESLLSCGGQIETPPGFLEVAQEAARARGALCIADEVQVGFGRVGTHFWGFETHGVVPDIVTMGKPIGNGHPLGAVATTRQVAEAFDTGMEYFNTFGGNPVSCAIGLAVLEVIRAEGLQRRAGEVGNQVRAGLEELAGRHALIGDVRGRGLFLGVEFVRDRGSLEPAADEARRVVEAARGLGVLLSTDGPLHNVIKIKPPLAFGETEADLLLEALDRALTWVR